MTDLDDRPTWRNKLKKVYFWFVIGNSCMITFMVVMYIKENISDVELIVNNVPSTASPAFTIFKLVALHRALPKLREVVDKLDDLFPKSSREHKHYKVHSFLKFNTRVQRFIMFMQKANLFIFIGAPLIKKVFLGIPIEKLPLEFWYPFNQNNRMIFPFVFVWQIFCIVITNASMSGLILLFYAAITMLSMHFDILCTKLEESKSLPFNERRKKVLEFVRLHELLLEVQILLEDIYSLSVFIHLATCAVFICLSGFQALLEITFKNIVKFVEPLMLSVFSAFITCFYGQKLKNANKKLTDTACDIIWDVYDDKKCRQMILTMIQRSQQTKGLSALKLMDISYKTFTLVSFGFLLA